MTADTPIWKITTFSSALLEHDGEICNEIHCASHDEAECLVELLNGMEQELAVSLENQLKAQAEVEMLTEQLDATKKLCVKFWDILKENGFQLKINNEYYVLPEAK